MITPNQYRTIDPYIERINQYDTFDSRIFLSNPINKLINMYGNDFVVKGFYPIHVDYTENIFEVILCGGIFICDNILIQIDENINLLLDVSEYDMDNGYLIIHPNYSYLDMAENNDVKIQLQYISKDGNHVYPNGWTIDRDRMYFVLYEFDNYINKFKQNMDSYIKIKHKVYYYRGFNNNNLTTLNYNIVKHFQSYNIQSVEMQLPIPPTIIDTEIENEYSKLIVYNRNLINLLQVSNMFDIRYFGHNIIVDDIEDDNLYKIYNYYGNIILSELSNNLDILKKSVLQDMSINEEFNRQQYELRSYNGNIILEETSNIENKICNL